MTQASQKILNEFEALPEAERAELLSELLRRVGLAPHGLPTDEELVRAADTLFVELDNGDHP